MLHFTCRSTQSAGKYHSSSGYFHVVVGFISITSKQNFTCKAPGSPNQMPSLPYSINLIPDLNQWSETEGNSQE